MLDNKKNLDEYLNKDGLARVKDLKPSCFLIPDTAFNKIQINAYLFKPLLTKKQEVWVQPTVAPSVMEYLLKEENLDIASVHVAVINPETFNNTSGRAGAPVIGVSFERAVQIALEQGFVKSIFHAETPGVNEWGVSGYLVIHLRRTVEEGITTLNLQAWQGSDVDSRTQYIHAIFPENMNFCQHLDGATMELELDSRIQLFYNGNYYKNRSSYQKRFRLDGTISWELFYKIVKSYFVFDKLTDEYFASKEIFYLIEGFSSDNQTKTCKMPLKVLN